MTATVAAAHPNETSPDISPEKKNSSLSIEEIPLIQYAIDQSQILYKSLKETTDSSLNVARSRLSDIRYTSSAHLHQTLEEFGVVKDRLRDFENSLFGKIKEGFLMAASNPEISVGVAVGLGVVVFKKPRRFLFRKAQKIFVSEQSLLSQADARVKELQKAVEKVKFDSKVLEDTSLRAEEEMERGKTKLRHAGHQIRDGIHSAYKIERQARGLKDALKSLDSGEVPKFRAKVSALASEVKKERSVLNKEVTKITNYGIPI